MVNPLLTILFDLFLIGSALAVTVGMAAEYLVAREPHIGSTRGAFATSPRAADRRKQTAHPGSPRRRAA